ncbi:MAG: flagellar biosynthesis protein FlgE [Gammaproteobacteria bacterium]|nr:MAG: flagellar biosynthesis protein FlgE [Gammaproteobacteria bacterium]
MINSVLAQGIQGVNRGLSGMQEAAHRVATAMVPASASTTPLSATVETPKDALNELTTGLVELKLYRVQAEASTKVIRTADETLGTLLDVKA